MASPIPAVNMKAILLCLCSTVLRALALDSELIGELITPDDFAHMKFILYSNSRNASYRIADAAQLLTDPAFDADKPTVLYMHGWTESPESTSTSTVTRAFLRRGSHNYIALDWSIYVLIEYVAAIQRVTPAGKAVAAAVNRMVEAGLNKDTFWIIGHSLGVPLSGVTARNLDFKPYRVTGLDPAGPGYYSLAVAGMPELTRDDAVIVDVVQTDAGVFGVVRHQGTIDFWPNGGHRPQPGCLEGNTIGDPNVVSLVICSHQRSWGFFAESVIDETAFPAVACSSYLDFQAGLCPANDTNVAYMGFAAPAAAIKGTFYLRTAGGSPFGLGVEGTVPKSSTIIKALAVADAVEAVSSELKSAGSALGGFL